MYMWTNNVFSVVLMVCFVVVVVVVSFIRDIIIMYIAFLSHKFFLLL